MKRTICAILTASAFAFAMSLPIAAQDKDDKAKDEKHEHMEQHPAIKAAIHHLEEAKKSLESASHDFGGHRAAALKHVNEALEECNDALHFDKK